MDYTEIIQSASDKYYKSVGFGKLPTEVYIDGIKSDIAKQIADIEVVKGKIEVLKDMDSRYGHLTNGMLVNQIQQEQVLSKLLIELNQIK